MRKCASAQVCVWSGMTRGIAVGEGEAEGQVHNFLRGTFVNPFSPTCEPPCSRLREPPVCDLFGTQVCSALFCFLVMSVRED